MFVGTVNILESCICSSLFLLFYGEFNIMLSLDSVNEKPAV